MSGMEPLALPGLGSILGIAGGAASIGSALIGNKPGSAPPPVTPPTPMPDVDSTRVAQARRRSIAAQQSRQGRDSTILTEAPEAKLGG